MSLINAATVITEARLRTSLTLDEWAKKSGVGRATLSRIIAGQIPNPGVNTLAKACRATLVPFWVYIKAQEECKTLDVVLREMGGTFGVIECDLFEHDANPCWGEVAIFESGGETAWLCEGHAPTWESGEYLPEAPEKS